MENAVDYVWPAIFLAGFQILGWAIYWWYLNQKIYPGEIAFGLRPSARKSKRRVIAISAIAIQFLVALPLAALAVATGLNAGDLFPKIFVQCGLPVFLFVLIVAFSVTPLGRHLSNKYID